MAAWTTVPCLLTLRDEFNAVNPHRDKGADGTIGDHAHTSTSDHTPDEDSSALRDRDTDAANEVHALDIDSTGPWPEPGWFGRAILALVAREKVEFESPTIVGRLQYVIWNRRIASRSWGWTWRDYTGPDPHTNHAHFSARYLSSAERDTRPWGVEEDGMPSLEEIRTVVRAELKGWTEENPDSTTTPKEQLRVGGLLRMSEQRARVRHAALLAAITGVDVDEQAVATSVLAGLTPELIAAAIPQDLARRVADELAARLAS